jgi:hypothetical protein
MARWQWGSSQPAPAHPPEIVIAMEVVIGDEVVVVRMVRHHQQHIHTSI